ncbi:hypothetical protein PsorP6_012208 [Peronosclerospora sorghi]|uniref:Uncharacterized protein n=1 Tax=Peronosclerospora sorghi TaxID=230839 RepID=A0ACC0WHI3_9STRA|nr:hypothetical protein PsorP6_012208 [Peronosclerospora sorghi]
MPKYFGRLDESLDLYFFQAQKYCQSQNIDIFDDRYLNYAIPLITINLRCARIEQLRNVMSQELVPVDIQERLREKLDDLKRKNCRNFEEYIDKFRKLMSDVRDMSNLDRVMCLTRGLLLRTWQEVRYRRYYTTKPIQLL